MRAGAWYDTSTRDVGVAVGRAGSVDFSPNAVQFGVPIPFARRQAHPYRERQRAGPSPVDPVGCGVARVPSLTLGVRRHMLSERHWVFSPRTPMRPEPRYA